MYAPNVKTFDVVVFFKNIPKTPFLWPLHSMKKQVTVTEQYSIYYIYFLVL